MAPRPNLPRIIKGPGPKSIPGLKKRGYKKAGPKYGPNTFVLPKPAGPAKPPTPQSPYEKQYGDVAPWAIPLLEQIDTDQQRHQGYVSDKVMPWLSQGLAALTGVDPNAPGYNSQVQQQYLANVQGPVGNALNAAAGAQPAAVAPTTPGGAAAAPNAYLGRAMGEYAAQRGGANIMMAQAQSVLNTVQANTFAQGALRTIADYAAGLPEVYVTKRNELRSKIDQWVAEQEVAQAKQALDMAKFEETLRSNRVDESIRATNSETQAAIALGNLGLKADDQAFDQTIPTGAPPAGYVQLPDGRYARDPSYVPPSGASGSSIDKTLTAERLKKQGFVGGWKTKPKNVKGPFVRASDTGQFFKKAGKAGSSGSGSSAAPTPLSELNDDLYKRYHGPDGPGFGGGWQGQARGDPGRAADLVVRWILENKASFTKNGKPNVAAITKMMESVIGGPNVPALVARSLAKHISGDRWR